MNMKIWLLRFVIFSTFMLIGRWIASYSRQAVMRQQPQFQLSTQSSGADQQRLILIIVDQLDRKPKLNEVWWIGSRVDMPIMMVSLYPYFNQEPEMDDQLKKTFALNGIWSNRQPQEEFFDTLAAWGVHWDNFIVIDQSIQTAIIDSMGGLVIDGTFQGSKLIVQKQGALKNEQDQLIFQSKLWAAICSRSYQQSSGLDLHNLPVKLPGHFLSSSESADSNQLPILPANPTFPVCLMNTGLREAALPPIQP